MKTYIVIPAYNEEKSITKVVEGLLSAGYNNIVIVDDGSADKTAELVRGFPVYYVRHIVNLGQGASLQTGTDFALRKGADIIVHFDADGQHKVEEITDFISAINNDNEAVLGSRFLSKTQSMPWSKRWLILKPAIGINWFFTGVKLTDAHNGFRALSRTAAQKIRITQNRMAHATEIITEIKRHDLKHTEIPVEIIYQEYGQNLWGGVKIVIDLLKQKIFS